MIDFEPNGKCLFVAALLAGLVTPAAQAESFASSASSASSTSVGSLSTSVEKSSDGSSKGTKVADGDYRVIDIAEVPARPGTLRVKLQALAEPRADGGDGDGVGELILYLPRQAAERGGIDRGAVVSARQRPYGLEFARGGPGGTHEAFFLVLADDWYRELHTSVVSL